MLSGRIIRSYRFSSKLGPALGVTRKLVRRYITSNNKAQAKAKSNHLRSKVTEFLFREDNCTILPGKKDVKKVGDQSEQKKVLSDYLHNLHFKFKLENPDIRISRTTFFRLRPKHVLTVHFLQ